MKKIINKISNYSSFNKLLILLANDTLLIMFSLFLSFFLRYGEINPITDPKVYIIFFLAPFLGIPIFYKFGIYNNITRFYNFRFIINLVIATLLYAFVLSTVILLIRVQEFPRSVLFINALLIINLIILSRLFAKLVLEIYDTNHSNLKINSNSLIFGADRSGNLLSEQIKNSFKNEKVHGFIENDKKYIGRQINYISIFDFLDLSSLIKKYNIDKIYINKKKLNDETINILFQIKSEINIDILTYDDLSVNFDNEFTSKKLPSIQISDILERDKIEPDLNLLKKNIIDKSVLITGAGGSIGSELSLQIFNLKPKIIILYELHEYSLFKTLNKLKEINITNKIKIIPILGDLSSKEEINNMLIENNVNTIFHSSAYKHVNLSEINISQTFTNNIFTTYNLVESLEKTKVENLVLISTDKAVRPTSIMGASKRICEKIIMHYATKYKQDISFSIVRFGNVLNSSGSVIPIFQEQIDKGGPVTVTDARAMRYFMSIEEAAQLVIQSSALENNFGIYILDMGNPVKIIDIAKKMILLSGKKIFYKNDNNIHDTIKIDIIGLNKGEKLFEELLITNEIINTSHTKIKKSIETEKFNNNLIDDLNNLISLPIINNEDSVNFLIQHVEEFRYEKK